MSSGLIWLEREGPGAGAQGEGAGQGRDVVRPSIVARISTSSRKVTTLSLLNFPKSIRGESKEKNIRMLLSRQVTIGHIM